MKKILIAGLFLFSVFVVYGKEYYRNDDDSIYNFYSRVIVEKSVVKIITNGVDKKDKNRKFTKILTGELKGDKIYISKMKYNDMPERAVPVEVSTYKELKGKIVIDNYEFIEKK